MEGEASAPDSGSVTSQRCGSSRPNVGTVGNSPSLAMLASVSPLLLGRREMHRHAVDAVAIAGRRRAVREHVAEMAAAAAAVHLGAHHEVAAIVVVSIAPSSGAKKLGQPVPLSNFRSATNSGCRSPRR